jgi:hypothetical protein
MIMLSYLVTSKTRKAMLRLLWVEGVAASVQELAAKAGASYAAAHRELATMERHGLAVAEGAGRSVVYAANSAYPHAGLLRSLLTEGNEHPAPTGSPNETAVVANLQRLGAPLTAAATSALAMPTEETLAQALVVSRHNATVLRVLPYVFAKLAERVNLDVVQKRAVALRQERSLAFVLDVAGQLSRNPMLRQRAAALADKRVRKHESYFRDRMSPYEWRLAMRNTPPTARKWHWVMNMSMDSFRSVYDKHAEVA